MHLIHTFDSDVWKSCTHIFVCLKKDTYTKEKAILIIASKWNKKDELKTPPTINLFGKIKNKQKQGNKNKYSWKAFSSETEKKNRRTHTEQNKMEWEKKERSEIRV